MAAIDGPVMILAGAGTGKTRTVTCRIANMLEHKITPQSILAVTFTNKAANEMRERIGGMVSKKAADAMTVCTFHSLCVRLLRGGIDRLGYKKNFSICAHSDQIGIMRQLIVRKGGADEKVKPEVVLSAISKAKNKGLAPCLLEDEFFAALSRGYHDELRAQNAVDFDDLLVLGERMLREHADVRDHFRSHFKRVTVDEFQDTNSLQMRLLQQLVGRYQYAASDTAGGIITVLGPASDPLRSPGTLFTGDTLHAFYLGANLHLYQDKLIITSGLEHTQLDDDNHGPGFNTKAWIWHAGARLSF